MKLSNADIVKALRYCGEFAHACSACIAHEFCSKQDYRGVEFIAADLIEQLEMDLENTRRCLGDLRVELQDREDDIAALESDLDSMTRSGNPFEASILRMKWRFDE